MGLVVILFLIVQVILVALVYKKDLTAHELTVESGIFLLIVMVVFNTH
jgi:hypothetical protein